MDHQLLRDDAPQLIRRGHVVDGEDLVLPLAERANGQHQPLLVWEVLLDHADAAFDTQEGEVGVELLAEDPRTGSPCADLVDDVFLPEAVDLAFSDGQQVLQRYEARLHVGEPVAVPGHELVQVSDPGDHDVVERDHREVVWVQVRSLLGQVYLHQLGLNWIGKWVLAAGASPDRLLHLGFGSVVGLHSTQGAWLLL